MLIPCLPMLALLFTSTGTPLVPPGPIPCPLPLPLPLETDGPLLEAWGGTAAVGKAGPENPSVSLAEGKDFLMVIEEVALPAAAAPEPVSQPATTPKPVTSPPVPLGKHGAGRASAA